MHATLPLLKSTDFPAIARRALDTLQVNVGYRCNQACHHCHVNASPDRSEMMARNTVDDILQVLAARTNWLATALAITVVAGGLVFCGTNNEGHRDPALTDDGGVLMGFRRSTLPAARRSSIRISGTSSTKPGCSTSM